ncbi:MAG: PAS domain S-box protein [Deltaproteobacteria bacterium]|nr:PAS domain S-box protein [Deltaproteobacteria bacterium]
MNILFLYADSEIAALVRQFLAEAGHPPAGLREVRGLGAALEELAREPADLVLLEPAPRDLPEREALGRLRRAAEGAALVVLAGHQDQAAALAALAEGAQDVLYRAELSPAELTRRLNQAVNRRRAAGPDLAPAVAEARLRRLVESNSDAMVVVDNQGLIRFVNEAALQLWELPRPELLGRSFGFPTVAGETVDLELGLPEGGRKVAEMKVVSLTWEGRRAHLATLRDVTLRRALERDLAESEERFRQLTGNMDVAFWLRSLATGRLEYVNPAFAEIWGLPPADHQDHLSQILGRVHPDDRPLLDRPWEAEGREPHPRVLEFRLLEPGGRVRWLRERRFLVRDGQGRAVKLAGLSEDVTPLKETEEELRRRQQLLDAVLAASPVGVALLEAERVLWANQAAREMLGLGPETDLDALDPTTLLARPEDKPGIMETLRELRRGGPPLRLDLRLRRRDGKLIDAHLQICALSEAPGAGPLVATISDISWRKEAELALRESEARYRRLFEDSPAALWEEDHSRLREQLARLATLGVKDLAAYFRDKPGQLERLTGLVRILDLNRATRELFDLPPKLAARQGPHFLFAGGRNRAVFLEQLQAIHVGHAHYEAALYLANESGEPRHMYMRWSVTPGRERDLGRVLVSLQDLTTQKRLEDQYHRLQKLDSLSLVVGGVAHDFNNLLMAMLGHAELALEQVPAGSPLAGDLKAILESGRRATALTRQMQNYAGQGRHQPQFLDLSQFAAEVLAILQVSLGTGAELHLDLAAELPALEGDPGQLQHLLIALLTNAHEALDGQGGRVTVSTRLVHLTRQDLEQSFLFEGQAAGDYLALEVRDSGRGMDPPVLDRAFDPFFSTKFTGRGMGLAAVLGIVRVHQGAVKVVSQPGQGTCFTVYLPVAARPSPAPPPLARPPLRLAGRVLVVDDQEEIRRVTSSMLAQHGLSVLTAGGGEEALDLLGRLEGPLDAVVLDWNMPGLSGEQAVRAIHQARSATPVLLTSGFNRAEIAFRAQGLEVAGFLQKPYKISQLLSELQRIMASREE